MADTHDTFERTKIITQPLYELGNVLKELLLTPDKDDVDETNYADLYKKMIDEYLQRILQQKTLHLNHVRRY